MKSKEFARVLPVGANTLKSYTVLTNETVECSSGAAVLTVEPIKTAGGNTWEYDVAAGSDLGSITVYLAHTMRSDGDASPLGDINQTKFILHKLTVGDSSWPADGKIVMKEYDIINAVNLPTKVEDGKFSDSEMWTGGQTQTFSMTSSDRVTYLNWDRLPGPWAIFVSMTIKTDKYARIWCKWVADHT